MSQECNPDDNIALIENDFDQFGTIESVELLQNGINGAYVTFQHDAAAYLAVKLKKWLEDKYSVRPANTWHQPSLTLPEEKASLARPPISVLKKHCFMEIFDRCDIETLINLNEVCPYFSGVLHTHYFRKFHKLTVDIIDDEVTLAIINKNSIEVCSSLALIRKCLKSFGPHINGLIVRWNNSYDVRRQRLIEKMIKYVGKNIRELELDEIHPNELLSLKSMLEPLTALEICDLYRIQKPQYLTNLFPNLSKLTVINGSENIQQLGHLEKLKHLSLYDDNSHIILPIFQNNPQLEVLKLAGGEFNEAIDVITRYLPKLKELTYRCDGDCIEEGAKKLQRLQQLIKLQLKISRCSENIDCIIDSISKCSNLLELYLRNECESQPNQNHLIALSQSLSLLEKAYFKGMKFDGKSIEAFIKHSNRLKELHLHSSCFSENYTVVPITVIKQISQIVRDKNQMFILCVDSHVPSDLPTDGELYMLQFMEKCDEMRCPRRNRFIFKGAT